MTRTISLLRRGAVTVVASVTAVSLAACTIGDPEGKDAAAPEVSEASEAGATSVAKKEKKAPEFSVKDGAEDVDPFTPVTVKSLGKGLETVTMTNEQGYVVAEKLSDDGKTWSSDETLGYNRTYSIYAKDENGKEKTVQFTTPEANGTAEVAMAPLDGAEVGVGQTVNFRFGVPVPDRKKAEEALTVEASPAVEGAFHWVNDYEVRWRPQEYWEPGTKVTAKAEIEGVDLGNKVYGGSNNEASFTIGDRVISIVDDATKTMRVYKNQELLREIPVSLGRDGQYATPNGRYIIGDEHEQLMMDSTTFGLALDAGGYQTVVDYATQMSYSGIYVHSAPWSVWAQGNTNTSHGCINVTPEAAQWFQQVVGRGDIVLVKNTSGGVLSPYDGLGDWNMSWEDWKAGNA
ncbi:Ig-like domain-containing protein [Corynebacterium sp. HMSC04H06]|uniref:L,D-transpeptidase n=1 Tax=Corynebacterium sp. HMSC04H06 TaxID=1581050 RepID=UPI0008A189BC|nr:Ig-like domain-containing protein [Corynebacterium sp. HMSC04H06]OFS20380.1 transpeptidase [Corynebacterium sp. HMSC04H06]